jgi:virulence-associated protein VagC
MSNQIARLFSHEGQQAVLLPAGLRLEGEEVWVRHDAATGRLILSPRSGPCWREFVSLRRSLGPVTAWAETEISVTLRDPFDTWAE